MASSSPKKNKRKKAVPTKVVEVKKEENKKARSTVKIKDIEKIIERKKIELQKNIDFRKKLQITIETENTKISELEGAIIALFELATGEKVE